MTHADDRQAAQILAVGGIAVQVAAIYRVSTDKQLRRDGDDTIPVQGQAVREFVAQQDGWVLVKEYAEEGVSGYKLSADERDVLQQAIKDCEAGRWQALVVFKADRLSRNSLEYPLVLERLRRLGCEVWSVKDAPGGKRLALDSQMDKFVRFLEGWQAETESKNTSIRVSEAMLQMAKQGQWSGGPPPYGFRLNPLRRPRSAALALVTDPAEAETVAQMVRLYLDERMGGTLVALELNRQGRRTRAGRPWDDASVRRILQNPIIAGLPAYNRTRPSGRHRTWKNPYDLTQFVLPRDEQGNLRPVAAYQIVPLERWLQLLKAMESNCTRGQVNGEAAQSRHALSCRVRAAAGLLTGLLFCGHCGARLEANTTRYKQARNDGSVTISKRLVYVCQTHAHRGRAFCGGQRTYGRQRLERAVCAQIQQLLSLLDPAELVRRRLGAVQSAGEQTRQRRASLHAELGKAERALAGWLERMDAFLGDPSESPYSEEMLTERVRVARERRDAVRARLHDVREEERQPAVEPVVGSAGVTPDWWACFERASPVDKKLLIRDLVERIVVRRDEVEVIFTVDLQSFLPTALALVTSVARA